MQLDTGKLDAIIFDLGGVIIDLDIPATLSAFATLAEKDIDSIFHAYKSAPFFKQYEVGAITTTEFRQALNRQLGMTAPDSDLDQAWNAMLLTITPERIDLIQKIKNRVPLFVLSNTNALHMDFFHQKMDNAMGLAAYRAAFKKIY